MSALRPGAILRLVSTTDAHSRLAPGSTGTVEHIDDAGTVHVRWEDGSMLGLIPGEDVWETVHERWWNQPFDGLDADAKEDDR